MQFITLRRPQRSIFNNFYDDFFETPTYYRTPSTFLVHREKFRNPFEDLLTTTWNDDFFGKSIEQTPEGPFEFNMNLSKKIPKENVKIEVENNMLTVKAEHRDGHSFESYSKSISIPVDSDIDKISAKLTNGKLVVTIPRIENKMIEHKVEEVKVEVKKPENVEKIEEKAVENIEKKEEEDLIIEDVNEEKTGEDETKPLLEKEEKFEISDADIYGEEKKETLEIPKEENLKDIQFETQ